MGQGFDAEAYDWCAGWVRGLVNIWTSNCWFKCSFWQLVGLDGVRAACRIFLLFQDVQQRQGHLAVRSKVEYHSGDIVISVWVGAAGFGALEWHLAAAPRVCVCLCQMLRPVVRSENATATS